MSRRDRVQTEINGPDKSNSFLGLEGEEMLAEEKLGRRRKYMFCLDTPIT